jgi:hypothetical protein
VSEFGTELGPAEEALNLGHPEVSIRFEHLVAVAAANGLSTELRPLAEWLEADLGARQLARPTWRAVQAWMRARGAPLPARAWTPEALDEAVGEPISGLCWVPATEPGPGPLLTRFLGLRLRKPAAG